MAELVEWCEKCQSFREIEQYELHGDSGIIKTYNRVIRLCACPRLCCSECETELDETGHCDNLDCWAYTLLIPIPILKAPKIGTFVPPAPRASGIAWAESVELQRKRKKMLRNV